MVSLLLEEDHLVVEELARRDRERLQGAWSFVSGTREAQLLIMGEHYTIQFKSGERYRGTITLDPTRKPKAMDMTIDEGPVRHQGKVAHAIYALDGSYLIWSPSRPGVEDRPGFFPQPEDREHLCIVFHREKARRGNVA